MRTISGGREPRELEEWRSRNRSDVNFGYDLMGSDLRRIVTLALTSDQRGLCAYTGIVVGETDAHIEHLFPQAHCGPVLQVTYANMVACYPAPNAPNVPYGAHCKRDWPSDAERHLFVSPRDVDCEDRFVFDFHGKIKSAKQDDAAARETIRRLGLDHPALRRRRKAAIDATLRIVRGHSAKQDLKSSQKLLARLENAEAGSGKLDQFCFVLKQVLRKHILRLENIKQSLRENRRKPRKR